MINILLTRNSWNNQLFQAFLSNINWKDKYRLPALPLTENQLFFVALTQVSNSYIQFDDMHFEFNLLETGLFYSFPNARQLEEHTYQLNLGNRFRKPYQKRRLPVTSSIIKCYLMIRLFVVYSGYLKINFNCPSPKCSRQGLNWITSVGFICFNKENSLDIK